jgi:hypothetical protein
MLLTEMHQHRVCVREVAWRTIGKLVQCVWRGLVHVQVRHRAQIVPFGWGWRLLSIDIGYC